MVDDDCPIETLETILFFKYIYIDIYNIDPFLVSK